MPCGFQSVKCWATGLALTWLEAHFSEQRMEWEMISYKGMRYLADTLTDDTEKVSLMAAAGKLV